MIPTSGAGLPGPAADAPPTKTLRLWKEGRVGGTVDGLDAMRQAVFLILQVERYENLIHSWNYGVELADLFGRPIPFVLPELERRIREALLQDSRITGVEGFGFAVQRGRVTASFTVQTALGDFPAEKEVEISRV